MAETKRARRAEHEWINKAGEVVEDIENAAGIRYTDAQTGESVAVQITERPKAVVAMLAAFGARTLATNVASQARQARANGSDDVSDIAAIEARFADMEPGKWATPADRTGGPRYDFDALALAIAKAKGETDPAPYRAKMEGDDGAAYARGAAKVPEVAREYATLKGKTAPTLAGL